MGISLFLCFDEHSGYTWTMDNLLIAKLMFDVGKPFPADQHFVKDRTILRQVNLSSSKLYRCYSKTKWHSIRI